MNVPKLTEYKAGIRFPAGIGHPANDSTPGSQIRTPNPDALASNGLNSLISLFSDERASRWGAPVDCSGDPIEEGAVQDVFARQ